MPKLESRLFVVTDRHQTGGRSLVSVLDHVLRAGAPAIQIRERDLSANGAIALIREVQSIAAFPGSQLVINDRIDVALALQGVGVHLRSDSLPTAVARRLLGSHRLLGVSAHSVEEVVQAEANGADYVILGPIYETPSKRAFGPPLGLGLLEKACRRTRVPVIGIGGISAARVRDVREAGAFGVAVITAVLGAADIEAATRELLVALATSS